ncbi:alkene reductase [Azonexus sp.]|uniref:alkene reductase n=1 Tax=Azonexus sp. TaxID=1872668 RepID=UPI0039E3E976
MATLFDPLQLGEITLANRIVMAPLTRSRAAEGNSPGPLAAQYYAQRASAGLIIAEASPISAMAQGYLDTPGIWSEAQVGAWQKVTEAVHAGGGKIVLQLWHVGRVSNGSLLPDGAAPVSSTAQPAQAKTFTREGFTPVSAPRALRDDEIPALLEDYRRAARNARAAGFDGVEIHAANTYLLEQFLRDSINDRSGPYGGGIENRARLVCEVAAAICQEIGAGRVGIRLSPLTTFGGGTPRDSAPQALYGYVVEQMARLGLAYVHMIEGETGGAREPEGVSFDYAALRRSFSGAWMVNNGYDKALAEAAVASGKADLVAFGKAFIANPDLVARLCSDAALNTPHVATFYGGGAAGYTDYPLLNPA